jgi:protein-tyrosine phosphatase
MEMLLRQALDSSIEVSSAGVRGLPAWPVSEPMVPHLQRREVPAQEISGFRSKFLDELMIPGLDLLVTASTKHTATVLEREPLAMRKTFTLGELAAMAVLLAQSVAEPSSGQANSGQANSSPANPDLTDAQRLKTVVAAAPRLRNRIPGGPKQYDIPDPYGLSPEHYAQVYRLIENQTMALVRALRKLPQAA